MNSTDLCDEVLISLRRIVRAIDLQSRQLVRRHGLTGPQAFLLKELLRSGEATVGRLADSVSLSKPTVTDILNRLEKRGLVKRNRSDVDRRCVKVSATAAAHDKIKSSPSLIQERFSKQFNQLRKWEQLQLISCLNRIAEMMDASELDAAPVLSSGAIITSAGITEINPDTPAEQYENTENNETEKTILKTG